MTQQPAQPAYYAPQQPAQPQQPAYGQPQLFGNQPQQLDYAQQGYTGNMQPVQQQYAGGATGPMPSVQPQQPKRPDDGRQRRTFVHEAPRQLIYTTSPVSDVEAGLFAY